MKKQIQLTVFTILVFLNYVAEAQVQKVQSADGVEIAYVADGSGEPALVFIHGWSCDKSYWSEQIKTFSPRFKVVAIDLAGHGDSGLNRTDFTMEKFGEDVASVVNALKLKKVILIGHSMGGAVIIEAAKLLGDKVIGLIGADTYQSFSDSWTADQKEGFLKTFKENFKPTTIQFVKSLFPKTADSLLVKKVAEDMSSAPPEAAVSAIRNVFFYDPVPVLKEINPRIIAICCDMFPVSVEENKKIVNSYEVKIMKGVGHFVMLENPEEFDKLLNESVNELIGNN